MIIKLLFLYLAHSLYLLEQKSNNLLIKFDTSKTAIITLQGLASQIQDENTYEYCPYQYKDCWIGVANNNSDAIDKVQLKINNFQIYDNEQMSYNTEFIAFLHTTVELEINDQQYISLLTLSPLSLFLNSFVYFGYSLCISGQDGYLKTRQNENLEKNQFNINGIKSQVYHQYHQTTYSIRISYLEIFDQVFDISNYSITILDKLEYSIFPIELMQKIKNLAKFYEFHEFQFDDLSEGFYRETNLLRIEFIRSIKFYNVIDQPLLIIPEDYIDYNYQNQGIDILKFIGDKLISDIIVGRSFLKNKIVHFSSLKQEIFIEQLLGEKCNIQQFQKDMFTYLDIIKIIIIIIFSIFVYAILRRIRVQYLLKVQKKKVDQQLILNKEAVVLK